MRVTFNTALHNFAIKYFYVIVYLYLVMFVRYVPVFICFLLRWWDFIICLNYFSYGLQIENNRAVKILIKSVVSYEKK
jgi:hypothetical protein